MITKAIIKRLYTTDDNHYIIYIPLFQKANLNESDATLPATALCISGIENTLKVGDVVYVGFEDNNSSRPVILSKLYVGKENINDITTTITSKSQETIDSAKLSANTKIGNLDIKEIYNAINNLISDRLSAEDIIYENATYYNVQSKLDALTAENENLKKELEAIKSVDATI